MDKIRKITQIVSTFLINLNLKGLLTGSLYTGKMKGICVPGLNCYSCPAAVSSCPLGLLQSTLGTMKRGINWYVIGTISFFSVLLGRVICGFLCPFGLIQELLYKIPTYKIKHLPKTLTYIKYGVLLLFIFIVPITVMLYKGIGIPGFCKYICPQGTMAGILLSIANPDIRTMIHGTFWFKIIVLVMILFISIIIYRPFCRVVCPLGAIYGLFNSLAFVQINIQQDKCSHCNKCSQTCPMEVDVTKNPNSTECIRCGKCVDVCDSEAINIKFAKYKISFREKTGNEKGH